jgi:hypothetical protein
VLAERNLHQTCGLEDLTAMLFFSPIEGNASTDKRLGMLFETPG